MERFAILLGKKIESYNIFIIIHLHKRDGGETFPPNFTMRTVSLGNHQIRTLQRIGSIVYLLLIFCN